VKQEGDGGGKAPAPWYSSAPTESGGWPSLLVAAPCARNVGTAICCDGAAWTPFSKVVGGCTTVLPVPWRVILASAASRFETGAVKTFPTPPAMKAPPDGPVAGRAAGAAGFEAIPEP